MLRKRLSEPPTVVKRTPFNDPWTLLAQLAAEQERAAWLQPPADVAQHFFRLTGRRRAPNERDALIVAGWKIFQYRLRDALCEVERHLLEGMMG